MLVGEAESVHVGAFGVGLTTTTVVLQFTEPPLPVAVRVYVVVTDGETAVEPFVVTFPMLEIETFEAL
jgi:hypothetical protein